MIKKVLILVSILVIIIAGALVYFKKQTGKKSIQPKQSTQSTQELRIQRDILAIRKFAESSDLAVQYDSDSKSSYDEKISVGIYFAGADQYEVDSRDGRIIQFGTRSLPVGSENEKIVDNSSKYTSKELEGMAREFIAKKAPNVNLETLNLSYDNKGANYFFKWEDRTSKTSEGYPFIQVGFSQGGTLLNYINAL
jgi:hypothetical protein